MASYSRRDITSSGSVHSARSERTDSNRVPGNGIGSGASSSGHPAVESAVTRLLMSIKQLLESLTQWSQLKIDEGGVSDVYVQLGNDFNAAVSAFSAYGIDMSELTSVPEELRHVLEGCLSEDANKETLDEHLPSVRKIITNLLQGLRGKQSIYRKLVSSHKLESSTADSRASRVSSRSQRTQSSRPANDSSDRDEKPEREVVKERDSLSRRSASRRSKDPGASNRARSNTTEDSSFVGGFAPSLATPPDSQHRRQPSAPPEFYGDSASPNPSPTPSTERNAASAPPQAPSQPAVPATVKRYSLVDKPLSATPPDLVVVEPPSPQEVSEYVQTNGAHTSSPPPDSPPIVGPQAPAIANSLAALQQSDTLERRASKRYSTYNISKMTGSGPRDRSGSGSRANRRSLAASNALTQGELAALTEVDDEDVSQSRRQSAMGANGPVPVYSPSPAVERLATPPIAPQPPSQSPAPAPQPPVSTTDAGALASGSKLTVFLQIGREVKKVAVEPNSTFSSLRMLFLDKFSYNPGKDNFPAIYVRDPSSGVQYELEDMDDVKEKCLLSLNIDPLDQIKQHIDSHMGVMSQEIKDLRAAVNTKPSHTPTLSPILSGPLAESTPFRPTDRQFHQAARRLSRFVSPDPGPSFMQPQMTGQSLQPQMTGSTDYSSRVVGDLRTQFEEVQNLRRDLGIMRQLYTEFMKQTKDSLGSLRKQTQSVKQMADTSVGGARAYIDTGKQKIDSRSQNILTVVEKLQDTVEGIRDDVVKKHITPKPQYMNAIRRDMDSTKRELDSLQEQLTTIKPMWKKTWAEELQNIVEEQGFLHHQEEFLTDLQEDYKAVTEVFGHVDKVIGLRGGGSVPRSRSFKPPPVEETGGINSVMMQIRGAAVDPEKRLKAIEASQRSRAQELATRSDDLQLELSDFVGQKKLKMTGGAEEAERVRQKRNDMTLKAMFTGGSISEFGA